MPVHREVWLEVAALVGKVRQVVDLARASHTQQLRRWAAEKQEAAFDLQERGPATLPATRPESSIPPHAASNFSRVPRTRPPQAAIPRTLRPGDSSRSLAPKTLRRLRGKPARGGVRTLVRGTDQTRLCPVEPLTHGRHHMDAEKFNHAIVRHGLMYRSKAGDIALADQSPTAGKQGHGRRLGDMATDRGAPYGAEREERTSSASSNGSKIRSRESPTKLIIRQVLVA